jgi:hypothetical protein
MWECYAALLRDSRLTFEQANERMRRYLVASLKLTPNAPTFLEARDAVLAAAWVSDRADYDLLVAAFAKRGMGAGAVGPEKTSTDHAGVVESFVTGADVTIDRIVLDQSKTDCDQDGVLDNGEEGRLLVTDPQHRQQRSDRWHAEGDVEENRGDRYGSSPADDPYLGTIPVDCRQCGREHAGCDHRLDL